MSRIPDFIGPDIAADKKNRYIGGRVTEGEFQFFLDLQSEWGIPKQGPVLRAILRFVSKYLPKIALTEGEAFAERMEARSELRAAMQEAARREGLRNDSCQAYAKAVCVTHEPTRKRLLEAGENHARLHDLEWPPSSVSPIQADPSAQYIYNRVITLIAQCDEPRVSLRDVVANSTGDKAGIMPLLARLEQHGYVAMEEERRSGPPTIWVSIPSLEMNC